MRLDRRQLLSAATGLAAGSIASGALAQTARQPGGSERPQAVVDSHVHLFDPSRISYPWLDAVPPIKRRIDTSVYRAAAPDTVDKIVVVEAAPAVESSLTEMRWLDELRRADRLIGGVVAQARVEEGARVEEELAALLETGALKGVRRIIGSPFQTDPDFALRPQLHEGVRALARHRLAFDLAGVSPANLTQATALVRACPDVPCILNHLGRAPIASGDLEPWRTLIRQLAEAPNAYCKISNVIRDAGPGWTLDRIRPFVEVAIDAFGIDRVLFGSDFPVVTLAERGGIASSLDLMSQLLTGASTTDRDKFFRLNATRLYRL